MTTKRDYYEILGVARTASVDEIKQAYRKLAMQFHPDRVSEDKKKQAEEKFKEISEAYAVLSDENKKKLYDQYGHEGIDSRFSTEDIFRNANFSDIFGGGGGFGSLFEDFFSDLGFDVFGSGSQSRGGGRKRKGRDLVADVSITFEESFNGVEKTITYFRNETCATCAGEGAAPGTKKIVCPACKGNGTVYSSSGFIRFAQTCSSCRGEGKMIAHPCIQCKGSGFLRKKNTLTVKIPAGIHDGASLRVRGEGESLGSQAGDLYVKVEVKQHPSFVREGNDVLLNTKVSLYTAVLGGEIEVPTLEGTVNMNIPEGTQPLSIFRLKGKGFPEVNSSGRGDEYVKIEIEIPKKLSARERELFQQLATAQGVSFKEKIKKVFS